MVVRNRLSTLIFSFEDSSIGEYALLKDEAIPTEILCYMNGKPVWDETRGWGVINSALDYVIFMDGTKSFWLKHGICGR